ncbi:NAD(P)-binding domain-containing protein [Candidatus Similichlamydia epinepheli]|uniref:NAD(P)-binding domain-containing protein n=1 Tax=Candidatus Similichlamydia epinepheli TaxID=1903953 RepID=UPI000D3588FF|nr:NAD(P)-binding domain-containing protein [Candidatus Similichlamydia epinepheli]
MSNDQEQSDIGLIGLGTMGANLALNFTDHHHRVTVYNRTTSKAESFFSKHKSQHSLRLAVTLKELVNNLKKPRMIVIMVSAGNGVDQVLEGLIPLLERGDFIIDGGNSHFLDTERRLKYLSEKGILFIGCGISGGEKGARHGPSMMPSGSEEARERVESILNSVAARDEDSFLR